MSASDALLLQRWISRADAEAFAELIARHSGLVYGTCRRILANPTEAEDLTQECFLKLSQNAPRDTTSIAGWLHRVATNCCLDRLRAEGRRHERELAYAAEQITAVEPTWNELQTCVDEAIAELPEELRLPILYHFFEGRTHLETARILGLTRSGVSRRLQRGVDEIREVLRRRGMLVSVAALAGLFTAHAAEAAPASLTASLARVALAGHSAGAAPIVAMSMTMKVAATALIVLAVAGIAAWPRFHRAQASPPNTPSARHAEKATAPLAPKPATTKTASAVIAEAAPPAAKRTVQGTVVSPEGYARPDVIFLSEGESESSGTVQSEVDGTFTLTNVPAGTTRWLANSFNTGKAALFTITPDEPSPLRVVLDLDRIDALGRVVDSAGKAVPKTRVEVRVTNASGESYRVKPGSADRSGYYECGPVPAGDGLTVEARVLPPGNETPGPWAARSALAKGMHGVELENLVVSAETALNIAANQPEDSSPCRLNVPERERIGGIVQDEAGRPIASASVEASVELNEMGHSWQTDTDAAGHWSLPIPANAARVSLRVQHRDYVGTALDRSIQTPPLARLRDGSGVLTLRRGLRIRGVVKDPQGNPVADALVLPHNVYSITGGGARPTEGAPMEDDYSVRTAPNGAFAFSFLPEGKARLRFLHPAYAPAVADLAMSPQMAPLDVVLGEGGIIRGRVVDVDGQPVPGAIVESHEWIQDVQNDIVLHATAGSDGAFELRHVPTEGTLRFGVHGKNKDSKERFLSMNTDLAPREEPYTITLYAPPVFSGTVVDDATGKLVTEFHIRSGWHESGYNGMYWNRMGTDRQVLSERGEFSLTIDGVGIDSSNSMRFGVGVDAPGYFTGVSPLRRPGEAMEPFVIRLRKGQPVSGVVCDSTGKTVAGAQVMAITPGRRANVVNGTLAKGMVDGPENVAETDTNGAFELPPCEGAATLLVLHASGYVSMDAAELGPHGKVVLTPWAKVEGVSYASGVPEAGAAVWLRPTHEDEAAPVRWMLEDSTHTNGRFEFDKVPAMELMAERILPNLNRGSHGVPVITEPGVTAYVELGLGGRQAVGRLVCDAPPPFEPAGIRACAISKEDPDTRYGVVVEPDGRFRIESLPQGSYTLSVEIYKVRVVGWASRFYAGELQFTMPDTSAETVEDLGELRLEKSVAPEPGSAAPNFHTRTLDGQDFSLDSLRGQYVVLNFWQIGRSATEQAAQARDFWARYRASGKVAFVGITLSYDPKRAARFVQEIDMPGTQVLGDSRALITPISVDYGVTNVPSLWIIDPDGTVVARDLTPESAAATLKATLGF